jgi:pimeloyl-ACP methyl ester carboxylesterase
MKQSQAAGTLSTAVLAVILLLGLCSFSSAQSSEGNKPPVCQDSTPHKAQLVTVAPGVKLEVLDWGGSGRVMVLLTGLGDNAHVFDEFAFQFTPYFHVIGITRRGFLPSSQPVSGYDVGTRAADDIAVLEALGVDRAVFVGHSLAGSELSAIGEDYKDRVDKLVYLDAYDLAERFGVFPEPPGTGDAFTDADATSFWIFDAATARYEAIRRPAQATCMGLQFNAGGAITGSTTPDWIAKKILDSVRSTPPVNWANISTPRLGIFALYTLQARQPWFWYLTPALQTEFDERWPEVVNWAKGTVRKFNYGKPSLYLLPGAPHYVYLNNETDVVREMRKFLGISPPED